MIKRLLLPASLFLVTILACHKTLGAPPIPDGVRLVPRTAWGAHAPALPMLGGHRDFADTLCPGRNLYGEIPRLRALIADDR